MKCEIKNCDGTATKKWQKKQVCALCFDELTASKPVQKKSFLAKFFNWKTQLILWAALFILAMVLSK